MTFERSCLPASVLVMTYVVFVAAEMLEQVPPTTHRCHWKVYVGAGLPDHVPVVVVTVSPTDGVPLTTGNAVFLGAVAALAW